jgi:hypothetical protein
MNASRDPSYVCVNTGLRTMVEATPVCGNEEQERERMAGAAGADLAGAAGIAARLRDTKY